MEKGFETIGGFIVGLFIRILLTLVIVPILFIVGSAIIAIGLAATIFVFIGWLGFAAFRILTME